MTAYSPGGRSGSRAVDGSVSPIGLRRAEVPDMGSIRDLLASVNLPLDGVDEAFTNGVVAVVDGAIVGAAAVEPYGTNGLLRSVAVDPGCRGAGIGSALVAAAEAVAAGLGVGDLYLLTETAAGWFPGLGYELLDRAAAPAAVAASVEFTVSCVDTGVLMHRRLSTME
jgi:N-acetylglutamate synthase-like GNAT family acetyltransferase